MTQTKLAPGNKHERCEQCGNYVPVETTKKGRCFICRMRDRIKKGGEKTMPVIQTPQGGEFSDFIKPEDLGKTGEAVAKINSPHRMIESTAQAVIDLAIGKKTYSFGLNKTNAKRLIEKFGDNTDKWVGKSVTLIRVMANNPKTKTEVPAIRVKEDA